MQGTGIDIKNRVIRGKNLDREIGGRQKVISIEFKENPPQSGPNSLSIVPWQFL